MTHGSTGAKESEPIFRLWDEVGIFRDGVRVGPERQLERRLLAALLLEGRIPRGGVVDRVWDDSPPASSAGELSKFNSNLRTHLGKACRGAKLDTSGGMCHLLVPDDSVDQRRFTRLVRSARSFGSASPEGVRGAWPLLVEALDLTAGAPLGGLTGLRVETQRQAMRQERFAAELRFARTAIELGKSEEHLALVRRLARESPEKPEVTCLAMRALYLTGRQDEANIVYHAHREIRDEVTASPPSREVLDMQQKILTDHPSLRPIADEAPGSTSANRELVLAFMPEAGDPEALREPVAEAFAGRRIDVDVADGALLCVVPSETEALDAVGVGLDRLSGRLAHRVRVGAAFTDRRRAIALAESETALRVLWNAASKSLVVTVAEELYRMVNRYDTGAYRPAEDGTGGWIRVPGYSIPPGPDQRVPPRPDQARGPMTIAPTIILSGNSRIDNQSIGDVVNNNHYGNVINLPGGGPR
ncbi:DNA-binding SARP family transcriptional activator [Actinokineospora auranticolor]|uniref:DNA-binding SARP family transcriptional activator n=2 Tax=Actinokineospora auranticolor TaxID=155976 RepID=A0A2S6H108_9PSEU|nr:DNA-binding SARP family transcriptional activator [Actinokineospora auranticolor]